MALRNQPYLPLYVQDFLTDEKLMECSASATGVYIRLMCVMHKSEEYGCILLKQKDKQTSKQTENFALKLARYMPYSIAEISAGLDELLTEGVLVIDEDKLFQKRMVRDNEISNLRADAGKKGGIKTQSFAKARKKAKSKANTEGEDDNENGNVSNYVILFNKVITENKIELTDEFKSLFLEWLKYKSEKGQTYKETGLKSLLIKAMIDCENDPAILRDMILFSTSKNYDGLFKDTTHGGIKKSSGASDLDIAELYASKHGIDSPGRQD